MHDEPPITKVSRLKHVNKVVAQQNLQPSKVVYLNYVAPWVGGTLTICP
jgi:hypothetical protein